MIEVVDLKKAYGSVQALRGVSFNIAAGEIIGLLGPNGAGKSTIIKTLTGFIQPDSGDVKIDGLDVLTQTQAVQERIGYLPENAPLYPELSVQSYLKMMAGLRQIPADKITEHISEAVYATGLQNHLNRPIRELSKGYRQRVGLAQAILHRPRLLILDEPTVGLDPTQIVEIRHLIRRLSQRSTILFSTHILPEVEALCDRVIILLNGEIRTDARLSELEQGNGAILVLDGVVSAESALKQADGVATIAKVPSAEGQTAYRVTSKTNSAELCPTLYRTAVAQGWMVRELRPDVVTLESIFNRLVSTKAEPVTQEDQP